MDDPMRRILNLLDLEERGPDAFVGRTPTDGPPRLFGGQVAAQSLRAATRTVPDDRVPHSLHAYFMRPGRPGVPLDLDVARHRDGRSFTTRMVTASQEGETIFSMLASFHVTEEGTDWQPPAPEAPEPETVDWPRSALAQFSALSPFEMRPVRDPGQSPFPVLHPFWVRTRGPVPDDPALHACLLTFISDMGVVGAARAPGTPLTERFMGASLDHAMWFHRTPKVDDWLLFSAEPASTSGARGLARGSMHTRDGVLVASIAQEALLRGAGRPPRR